MALFGLVWFKELHSLRRAYADDVQTVFQYGAYGVGQLPAGVPHGGGFAFDAVVVVELVEAGGQIDKIPVNIRGIVVPGGQTQFFGILGNLLDQLPGCLVAEQGDVRVSYGGLISSSRSCRAMALPVRLDMRTGLPSCSRFTSCISTITRRLEPSKPRPSRAACRRATWP